MYDSGRLTIKYIDIDFNNQENLRILRKFYYGLYIKEFTDENERESLDNIIKQAKRINNEPDCSYHCIIAIQGDIIIGGIIGDYFVKINSGVIEFLVVAQNKRHQHIGTELIFSIVNLFNIDAQKLNDKSNIDYCFFEVENPDKVLEQNAKENSVNRLGFWNKISAKILNLDYIQPPLENGKEAVNYLFLAIYIINSKLSYDKINKNIVISFLKEYLVYAFGINDYNEYDIIRHIENMNSLDIEIQDISEAVRIKL